MYVYVISYVILLCISLFEVFDDSLANEYLKEMMLFLLVFILIILAGIRYEIGMDFSTYFTMFQRVESMGTSAPYNYLEPGFKLIIIFFKSLNFPPYFMFFVFSSIIYTFIFLGIKKTSQLPFLSLFIFFSIFMIGYVFNVLRQGIAMSILVYLLPDFKEKNIYKVVFFTILAASIHSIGIFIFVSYFVYQIRLKKRVFITLTVIAGIFYSVSSELSNIITNIMPLGIQEKIISYMERYPGEVGLSSYLLRLILIGLLLFYFDQLKELNGFKGTFNVYFFGFIIYTFFSFQDMAAARLNMFFRILEVILIPQIVYVNKDKIEKSLVLVLLLAIATAILLKDLSHPINYPFQFYWMT